MFLEALFTVGVHDGYGAHLRPEKSISRGSAKLCKQTSRHALHPTIRSPKLMLEHEGKKNYIGVKV
jgi:hypothetical protein